MLLLLSVVGDSCVWRTDGSTHFLCCYLLFFLLSPGWQWWGMWMLGRALCWEFWLTVNWTMVEASLARSSSDTNTRWRAAGPAALEMTSWVLTRRARWAADVQKVAGITTWPADGSFYCSTASLLLDKSASWRIVPCLTHIITTQLEIFCIFHRCLYGCK